MGNERKNPKKKRAMIIVVLPLIVCALLLSESDPPTQSHTLTFYEWSLSCSCSFSLSLFLSFSLSLFLFLSLERYMQRFFTQRKGWRKRGRLIWIFEGVLGDCCWEESEKILFCWVQKLKWLNGVWLLLLE